MVDVVGKAHGDGPSRCIAQRADDDGGEVVGQVQVVDGDVERVLRGADELGQRVRGLRGRLAAVDQRPDFDRLYSRFAAW
jgi:hypothetical protein